MPLVGRLVVAGTGAPKKIMIFTIASLASRSLTQDGTRGVCTPSIASRVVALGRRSVATAPSRALREARLDVQGIHAHLGSGSWPALDVVRV